MEDVVWLILTFSGKYIAPLVYGASGYFGYFSRFPE